MIFIKDIILEAYTYLLREELIYHDIHGVQRTTGKKKSVFFFPSCESSIWNFDHQAGWHIPLLAEPSHWIRSTF